MVVFVVEKTKDVSRPVGANGFYTEVRYPKPCVCFQRMFIWFNWRHAQLKGSWHVWYIALSRGLLNFKPSPIGITLGDFIRQLEFSECKTPE